MSDIILPETMSAPAIVKPPSSHGFKNLETEKLQTFNLADENWRLNNLYTILNKELEECTFNMNEIQRKFYKNLWYRNILLKSRQVGGTTLIQLMGLNRAVFIKNFQMVVIAHTKPDAEKIMEQKIIFPYMNLHPELRDRNPIKKHNTTNVIFENGSHISVATSGRSGTNNYTHISELGHIAAFRPDKAKEIISGSLSAVHGKGMFFIESTAEGSDGLFFDLCQSSKQMKEERLKLTTKDFKFHFFGWHEDKKNQLSDEEVEGYTIPKERAKYFDEIQSKYGITTTINQQAWYCSEARTLQQMMLKENPSTPEEAFQASGDGMILDMQMSDARTDGRIGVYRHVPGLPVHTFWDIGLSKDNETAIWFMQKEGNSWNCIYYLEGLNTGMETWMIRVRELAHKNGWLLGYFVGPHDLKKRNTFDTVDLWTSLKRMGVEFEVVPRVGDKITSIQALRSNFAKLSFDKTNCEMGIKHLDNYRWEFDAVRGVWLSKPRHDKASNGADALQQWALWIDKITHVDGMKGKPRPDRSLKGKPRNNSRNRMAGYL